MPGVHVHQHIIMRDDFSGKDENDTPMKRALTLKKIVPTHLKYSVKF